MKISLLLRRSIVDTVAYEPKETRSVHYMVQDLVLRISNALNGTTDCFIWLPDWCSSVSMCDP